MVRVLAARTAEYLCENCNRRILICDRCLNFLENHENFDADGDDINCLRGGPIEDGEETRRHIVPGCKMKKAVK